MCNIHLYIYIYIERERESWRADPKYHQPTSKEALGLLSEGLWWDVQFWISGLKGEFGKKKRPYFPLNPGWLIEILISWFIKMPI